MASKGARESMTHTDQYNHIVLLPSLLMLVVRHITLSDSWTMAIGL
jgi:hypothetical protein